MAIRPKPFKGDVRMFPQSGLRKRMRAAARGMMPDEVQVKIDAAIAESAKAKRHKWQRPPSHVIAPA